MSGAKLLTAYTKLYASVVGAYTYCKLPLSILKKSCNGIKMVHLAKVSTTYRLKLLQYYSMLLRCGLMSPAWEALLGFCNALNILHSVTMHCLV